MSPKGGIKPHTKFQVQSKRSEVLFVDYIAEHLTPNGRAAVVVPEGIIFHSQSAYVALRKMLVENHLAAVISLPAGVFNPYSGVKTSILILELYRAFLEGDSSDPDLPQYPDYADEVRVNFVHASYMSEADISFCRTFGLAELTGEPNFPEIEALHVALSEACPDEEEEAA